MKNGVLVTLLSASIAVCCTSGVKQRNYTDYVNPFLGTETLWDSVELGFKATRRTWGAEVYPGSSLPNAMVQVSPVTMFRSGAGYQYEDSVIFGFSHTNKGHWNLNHVPILPVTGSVDPQDYTSAYSHDNESARPAYYQVFLERYGINVELTSSLRCAFHRYTTQNGADIKVLVNLPRSNERVSEWEIAHDSERSFSGYQHAGEKIYFYATTNRPIAAVDTPVDGIPTVTFKPSEGDNPLEMKIGFSFVSIDGAKKNLETEILDMSFEQVKAHGNDVWNAMLGKIDVTGGTQEQQSTFYSTLYRSMLWPALRSDVDGSFTDEKGNVVNRGFEYYTDPSFWDDYRNKLILLGMISPKVACDVISSCIDRGNIIGHMPTFFHGDHASTFVTGSYLRGLKDFDIEAAYRLILGNATVESPARPYLQEYIDNGYISEVKLSKADTRIIHIDAKASVTKTQEYCYDDYAVALLAKELGDTASYNILMGRTENYRNLFDPQTQLMRGRLADGSWVENFDPYFPYYMYMYREATAWQSAFFAPHDTHGMIELYGGADKFEQKLDSLFTIPWKGYEAHNISGFIGQYCHGNQPDHSFPFLYHFLGKPEKSQAIIDRLLNEFYNMGEHKLAYSGMDDAGEMSSWYVLSAIGLYTYSPADAEYIVSVPLFDKVKFQLGDKAFKITKRGCGRNLESIKYDGKPIDGYFIDHAQLLQGKELVITTK